MHHFIYGLGVITLVVIVLVTFVTICKLIGEFCKSVVNWRDIKRDFDNQTHELNRLKKEKESLLLRLNEGPYRG